MNAMTKAHEIRKAAAEKWNCKVSEICFAECLRMAHNGEELATETELTTAQKLEEIMHIIMVDNNAVTSWEYGFLCDNADRLSKYGEKTFFSEKQAAIIDRCYNATH